MDEKVSIKKQRNKNEILFHEEVKIYFIASVK